MMQLPIPYAKELVLVGGGHAHALLLKRWGMKPVPGARLTLINPAPTAPYTGMLPGFVAGHYMRETLEIDLVRLARFAGARLIFGMVEALDPLDRRLSVAGRPSVPFDVASIDIGITSEMAEVAGFEEHAVAAKPLGPFARRWQSFLEGPAGDVAVIGGGVAGIELAMSMRHALGTRGAVTVIEASSALKGLSVRTRSRLLTRMHDMSIILLEHTEAARISVDSITLSDGRRISAALTVGAAGARPFGWLETTGLDLTDGFVTVDEALRSVSHPWVYAAGDCAHYAHAPRPKAGVFAVRAAPILTRNLRADLTGGARARFKPQKNYLKIISLGAKEALAEKWGQSAGGAWAWNWKDHIDRGFMEKLNSFPRMSSRSVPPDAAKGVAKALGSKPLCGGCGAKVGSGTLDRALARLPAVPRSDVETIPGDDAAILRIGNARLAISTDHLRAFWDDPWLMSRIAAVHALNDIWASGAEPQAALAQITLPPMARSMHEDWLAEIIDGAGGLLAAEGVPIVGGHTSLGSEFTIGFTVTGLVSGNAVGIAGAREGDAIVLSGAMGGGTILAAEMEGRARGDDVARVLTWMAEPRGRIARRISLDASALTDVTGFGLAGHLARLACASGLSAELFLEHIPVFPGAMALAAKGVRSTIWAENRAAVDATIPEGPSGILLFDPQTAGGFLATMDAARAHSVVTDLADLGCDARIIGHMTAPGSVVLKAY